MFELRLMSGSYFCAGTQSPFGAIVTGKPAASRRSGLLALRAEGEKTGLTARAGLARAMAVVGRNAFNEERTEMVRAVVLINEYDQRAFG